MSLAGRPVSARLRRFAAGLCRRRISRRIESPYASPAVLLRRHVPGHRFRLGATAFPPRRSAAAPCAFVGMTGGYLPRHWLQRDNLDQLHISMGTAVSKKIMPHGLIEFRHGSNCPERNGELD